LRPFFCYILIAVSVAFILMFFVSQRSRHVQIGYELTQLRRERGAMRELGRKLDFEISKRASRDALVEVARRLGLTLQAPLAERPGN